MALLQRNRIGNGIRLTQTGSCDLQELKYLQRSEDNCQVCDRQQRGITGNRGPSISVRKQ